jgi:splicing factor 3A subunit 1
LHFADKLDALKQTEKYVISPLTGEKVPADKLADHMRFNTVDSQYFMQKEKLVALAHFDKQLQGIGRPYGGTSVCKRHGCVVGTGQICRTPYRYFWSRQQRRRTDGYWTEGAHYAHMKNMSSIILQLVDEDKHIDPRALWDGRIQSINQTQRFAQSKITIEQQLADIQRITGIDPEKERIGPKSDPVPPPTSNQPPIRAPARPDYPSIKVSAWEETQPPKTRPKPMPTAGEPRNPNMMPLGGGYVS